MNSTNREELVKPASEEKGEEKENTDYKVYILNPSHTLSGCHVKKLYFFGNYNRFKYNLCIILYKSILL